MMKTFLTMTALGALTLAVASAQTAPPGSPQPTPPAATRPAPDTVRPDAAKPDAAKPEAAKPAGGAMQVIASQSPDQWLASKFRGTDVLGPDNKQVGDVSDVLFDQKGQIVAYVISVGGFLGMGAKEIALPPSAFEVVAGDRGTTGAAASTEKKLKISATKEQLDQLARFEPYREPPQTTGAGPAAPRGDRLPGPAGPGGPAR